MQFRKRLFSVLAVIALLWCVGGVLYISNAAYRTYDMADEKHPDSTLQQTAYDTGVTIGATVFYAIVLCTGIPALLLFSVLAWRNSVALATARRHQEQIQEHQRILEMMRAK